MISSACSVDSFEAGIAEIVTDLLPADLKAWFERHRKPKIIHDNLWGTTKLEAHEVAVLDTALIQRLRRIHQTGAVYLIYPSALHSRFEHSVGVLVQATRLCESLAVSSPKHVNATLKDNIRIAALLHDAGHGPFSHTSEQFYARFPVFKEARVRYGLPDSGPGEILSYSIIRSEPLKKFLTELSSFYDKNLDPDLIAGLVTGTLEPNEAYKCEIIHGPFDADKLDYMHRDSVFTGFKMNIDLDRLYYSIQVRKYGKRQRLSGSFTGTTPLTQIMFNKMQLFTSVYHHHKVRAADCMIWGILSEGFGQGRTGGVELKMPFDILKLTDDKFACMELTDSESARNLMKDLQLRRLFKRALIVNRRTIPKRLHEKANARVKGPISKFILKAGNDPENIAWRENIAQRIWDRAGSPCQSYEVWLDIPTAPSMREAEQMWINDGGGKPKTLQAYIPVSEWVSLYGTHRWTAHVFCPEECTGPIGLAAAAVLQEEVGLEFEPSAFVPSP